MRNLATRSAMFGKSAGWQNPYVTDGLVAMWDGEWNAGGGVHDSSTTDWTDIINGIVLSKYGAVAVSWKDKSCTFTEGSGLYSSNLGILANLYPYGITIEAGMKIPDDYSGSGVNPVVYAFNENAGSPYLALAMLRCNVPNSWWYSSWLNQARLTAIPLSIREMTLSVRRSSNSSSINTDGFYKNGQLLTPVSRDSTVRSEKFSNLSVGCGCAGGTSYDFVGDIYFLRVYNRNLTASEISYNYNVDYQRFGIT